MLLSRITKQSTILVGTVFCNYHLPDISSRKQPKIDIRYQIYSLLPFPPPPPLRSRASRFLRSRFVLPLPPGFTHYKHSTGIQIPIPNIYFSLLLHSKDLDSPCTHYYVNPSQDHSTGCPTHMTFYPPHTTPPYPTLLFSPTTGTLLGFEYPSKILTPPTPPFPFDVGD